MNIELATARDRGELLAFLLGVFRAERPNHAPFEDIYPDLFLEDDGVLGRHAVIREEGRIVACVGTYPIPVRLGGCQILTAGVGQVATAPSARGKGYMTALLSHGLERCRNEGAAIAWLGGRRDRYAPFGFDCAGLSFDYTLDSHSLRGVPRTRLVSHADPLEDGVLTPEIFRLRSLQADTALVPYETYRIQLTRLGFQFELWSARPEGAGGPDAWAVVNAKNNCVEEWWGSADGRLEILSAYCAERGQVGRNESPADAVMNALLRERCFAWGPRSRSLAVLDAPRLLAALAPFVPAGFSPPEDTTPSTALTRLLMGPGPGTACLPFHMPAIFHV